MSGTARKKQPSITSERPIGGISNYYGGVFVKSDGERMWWGISNYDGDYSWEQISKRLYHALLAHDREYAKKDGKP